jgi:DNA-binding PadR family transcriptional regulator
MEDCQVCVHPEMIYPTLKRLEVPEILEVRWGGKW